MSGIYDFYQFLRLHHLPLSRCREVGLKTDCQLQEISNFCLLVHTTMFVWKSDKRKEGMIEASIGRSADIRYLQRMCVP